MTLAEAFTQPANLTYAEFTNARGMRVRHASLPAEGDVKATVVLVTGFRESLEKYFEAARGFAAQGIAVHIMDWPGQGGSERFFTAMPQRMHQDDHADNIATLHQLTTKIIGTVKAPLILVAHSMGAHIGLRYLQEHAGVFDSAVLSSPMFDIVTAPIPYTVARALAAFGKMGGYAGEYVPGGSDWRVGKDVFAGNRRTSDATRFAVQGEFYQMNPRLAMGDATYGWVQATFKSIDILNQEAYLRSINTPILMGTAGQDKIVDKQAQVRAASLLPQCTRIDFMDAEHEIWMECDRIRQPWVDRVGLFIQNRIDILKQAPTPVAISAPSSPSL